VPIAQRRPDFHTTIVEKLNEKTNTRKYVTHEEIQPARPERSRSALGRNASGERSAEGCYEVNAATNAATSFSPLRVCLSSAQAQQMFYSQLFDKGLDDSTLGPLLNGQASFL